MRPSAIRAGVLTATLAFAPAAVAAPVVGELRMDKASFNPSRGEDVRVSYVLPERATVTVRIVDADAGLVAVLCDAAARDATPHVERWDGRDLDGRIVPDEAFTAVVDLRDRPRPDSRAPPERTIGDITSALFDHAAGTMAYELPMPARVLVRLGIEHGPMLKTLVDWKPRPAGAVTEYWDGRDEDGQVSFQGHKDFRALITYVALSEATTIAYGNAAESYRDVKLSRWKGRPTVSPETTAVGKPRGLVPPAWARAPRVRLDVRTVKGDAPVPEVRERVDVRVDVDPADRPTLLAEQFEVIFFVDNVFFAEAERGYLPMTWPWELQQMSPGEHVLTVNVSSFSGQVGVASRKVRVVPPAP